MRVLTWSLALALCSGATARADLDRMPCRVSDALSETAALLLLRGDRPTPEGLSQAAREAGYHGTHLHASLADDDADVARWLRTTRTREDAQLLCGEALSATGRVVVAAPDGGELSLRDSRLFGRLSAGFTKPELVIQDERGRPARFPTSAEALRHGVPVPRDLLLPARVQLMAEGPRGPRPLAELELSGREVAERQPDEHEASDERAAPASQPASESAPSRGSTDLLSTLQAFRRAHDSGEVRPNTLLAQSAEQHARAVCHSGHVAHRLREGEDPVTRLRAQRIEARAVGEAIGRSRDPGDALQAVFESPSHRLAVLEKSFTDVGIGHARDPRGQSCVVVLLAAWPRRLP